GAGTGGTYALTFTASNSVATSPAQAFTLAVNQAPTITSANAATFTVGLAGTFSVTTSGFPAPSLTRGGVAPPSGATSTDNGNGTGTLGGTPATGTAGTYTVIFTAANPVGTNTQNFTLTVVTAAGATLTAPGTYYWTVPQGITQATFDVYGAQGGTGGSSG